MISQIAWPTLTFYHQTSFYDGELTSTMSKTLVYWIFQTNPKWYIRFVLLFLSLWTWCMWLRLEFILMFFIFYCNKICTKFYILTVFMFIMFNNHPSLWLLPLCKIETLCPIIVHLPPRPCLLPCCFLLNDLDYSNHFTEVESVFLAANSFDFVYCPQDSSILQPMSKILTFLRSNILSVRIHE